MEFEVRKFVAYWLEDDRYESCSFKSRFNFESPAFTSLVFYILEELSLVEPNVLSGDLYEHNPIDELMDFDIVDLPGDELDSDGLILSFVKRPVLTWIETIGLVLYGIEYCQRTNNALDIDFLLKIVFVPQTIVKLLNACVRRSTLDLLLRKNMQTFRTVTDDLNLVSSLNEKEVGSFYHKPQSIKLKCALSNKKVSRLDMAVKQVDIGEDSCHYSMQKSIRKLAVFLLNCEYPYPCKDACEAQAFYRQQAKNSTVSKKRYRMEEVIDLEVEDDNESDCSNNPTPQKKSAIERNDGKPYFSS